MLFLVLFFDSTAIMDAFLLKKNIISLKSKIDWLGRPASYYTQYGTTLIDIDSDLNFSKKELDEKFRISKQYIIISYTTILLQMGIRLELIKSSIIVKLFAIN